MNCRHPFGLSGGQVSQGDKKILRLVILKAASVFQLKDLRQEITINVE